MGTKSRHLASRATRQWRRSVIPLHLTGKEMEGSVEKLLQRETEVTCTPIDAVTAEALWATTGRGQWDGGQKSKVK